MITLAIITAASLAAFLSRQRLLIAAAEFLVVDEPVDKADLILILSGGVNDRPKLAAALYARGVAPLIALIPKELSPIEAGGHIPEEIILSKRILLDAGVPESVIFPLPISRRAESTFDEAVGLRDYADTAGIERVVVVTSAYHTRRARWIFRKVLAGSGVEISMAAAPSWQFNERNWWRKEIGLIVYLNEYIKFAFYLWHYRSI